MVLNPETKIERTAVEWLKDMGAYVVKLSPGPGVPVGAPDRLFVFRGKWGVIEFKRDAKAPFRVGQQETLKRLRLMNEYVYVVHPDNWPEIKLELIAKFF